jgi:dihydroorotase
LSAILIAGGRLIDPARDIDGAFDLLIADGRIVASKPAGMLAAPDGAATIDARGCWVVPGLVDAHVHLRDPGYPRKETIASGLRAAAAGGFTTVAAMANTSPVNDTPDVTRYMLEQARSVRAARLVPVSAVTKGLGGRELVDFAAMIEAGARLFSDDGLPIDDAALLAEALEQTGRLGYVVSLHEEDRVIAGEWTMHEGEVARQLGVRGMPAAAESGRVVRDIAVALRAGAPLHLAHLSTAASLEAVRCARRNGVAVTCEAAPHHLTLDEEAVLRLGPDAKMNPPLRGRQDVQALRAAIADGTIDMIATDHAPHDAESKQLGALAHCFADGCSRTLSAEEGQALGLASNGVVGLETAVGLAIRLVDEGLITPRRLVELMALNPARLLRAEAGTLAAGAAADVTVIDPGREWQVAPAKFLSRSRNTPFAGMHLKGRAMMTLVGGEIVYDGRVVNGAR